MHVSVTPFDLSSGRSRLQVSFVIREVKCGRRTYPKQLKFSTQKFKDFLCEGLNNTLSALLTSASLISASRPNLSTVSFNNQEISSHCSSLLWSSAVLAKVECQILKSLSYFQLVIYFLIFSDHPSYFSMTTWECSLIESSVHLSPMIVCVEMAILY